MSRGLSLMLASLILGVSVVLASALVVYLMRPSPPSAQSVTGDLVRSDFTLVDHTGRTRTQADFGGRWQLVFFGFTHCPDVCPTTLTAISMVLDELGAEAQAIAPLFITVDPERDTPEAMAQYVEAIDPRIVGLTGSPEQTKQAARSFRAYFGKAADSAAADYEVNHSTIVYLMDPSGRYAMHFSHHEETSAAARRVLEYLKGRRQTS